MSSPRNKKGMGRRRPAQKGRGEDWLKLKKNTRKGENNPRMGVGEKEEKKGPLKRGYGKKEKRGYSS